MKQSPSLLRIQPPLHKGASGGGNTSRIPSLCHSELCVGILKAPSPKTGFVREPQMFHVEHLGIYLMDAIKLNQRDNICPPNFDTAINHRKNAGEKQHTNFVLLPELSGLIYPWLNSSG